MARSGEDVLDVNKLDDAVTQCHVAWCEAHKSMRLYGDVH